MKELRDYGFSEKEARVYIATLTLGYGTANEIAEKAELVRTTTYDLLKLLKERGFVSVIEKNNVLVFEASNPNKLTQNLEEKKQKIKQVIPHLSKLKENLPLKPKVKFYEGKEGLKTVFQEILNAKSPLVAYSNNEYMVHLLPFFSLNFINKRVEKKIPIRILSEDSEITTNLLKKKDKKEYRETRIIKELNQVAINQYVYGDSVALLGSKENEPAGIIIKHKDFADCQKIIFERLWKQAK